MAHHEENGAVDPDPGCGELDELRAFFELAGCGMALIDPDTLRLARVNPKLCQILGYPEAELLGMDILRTIHPADRDSAGQAIQRLLRGEDQTFAAEKRYVRKDGRVIWTHTVATCLRNGDGRPRRLMAVIQDTDERRRAEEALRDSETRLRTLSGATFEGICISHMGLIEDCNEQFAKMLGYRRDELFGRVIADLVPEEERAAIMDNIRADRESEIEHDMLRKDRSRVTVEAHGRILQTASGPLRLTALRDITERKRAEVELRESEARFRRLMERVPIPLAVLNKNRKIIFVNDQFTRVFGYTLAEIPTLESWWRRAYPDAAYRRQVTENWETRVRRTADARIETEPREFSVICKDGTVRWVVITGINIEDDILAAFIDITERKRAEEALRESECFIKSVAEASPNLIYVFDFDGMKLSYANRPFMGDLGYPPEVQSSVNGLDAFRGFMPTEELPHLTRVMQEWQALADGRIRDDGYRLYHADGTLRHFAGREIVFARRSDGTVRQIIGMLVDITGLKQTELALREADRRKDEFLAMLSHELRNPLAPIRSAVQVLRVVGGHDAAVRRQQDIIERQVTHLARLVGDLLDASRVTRGKIELRRERLDLTVALAQAVELTSPLVEARHQKLSSSFPPGPLLVDGDLDRLAQAVGNLLFNAAKYTPEGGRVWLETARSGEEAVVRVSDDGIGIAPEVLPHVFDLFAQADQGLARTQGGLGIGLTMVKSLVELHGGTVEARSEGLGRGSEFIIRLPALPEETREPVRPEPASCPVAFTPRRILVVDDLVDTAASMAELLEIWGHEVRMAHDGPAALEAARAFRPEVVLLDIGMPGMDGYEVARRIRQEREGPPPLLVALTGYVQERDRRAAREAGFDRHLEKPVNLPALRDLLSPPAGGRAPASTT